MAFGIKVSKPSVNVGTVTDSKNLVFDSTLNQLKIKEVVTDDFTKSGNPAETFNVAHNAGYIPGYLAFIKVSSRWYGNVGEDPTSALQWEIKADASNIIVTAVNGDTTAFTCKAFILVDEGTDSVASDQSTDAFGVKVSDVGEDVATADDQGLSLSTLFETLQVIEVKSINNTSSLGEVTSAHTLSYTPAWVASAVDNNDSGKTILVPYLLVGNREMMVWSDGNDIGCRTESIDATEDITYKVAMLTAKLE